MTSDYSGKDRCRRQWVRYCKPIAARWLQAGLNLLLPPRCLLCRAELAGEAGQASEQVLLCDSCQNRLVVKQWSGCPRCGAITTRIEGQRCNLCRSMVLRFDGVTALGCYEGDLRDIVFSMKRESGQPLAEAAARLLAQYRSELLASWNCDLVVPIPMYWTRRLMRRTNNPETLAHLLAGILQVPCEQRMLSRCRNTRLQRELRPRERFRNVAGAFQTRDGVRLQGRRVLLVDDVMTTGATASEAAKVLKKAGAGQVMVAVIARAHGN